MRCYLMRSGHIWAVEPISATTDEERISEARKVFDAKREEIGADGFEVWDLSRFVYRFPEEARSAKKQPKPKAR